MAVIGPDEIIVTRWEWLDYRRLREQEPQLKARIEELEKELDDIRGKPQDGCPDCGFPRGRWVSHICRSAQEARPKEGG